MLKLQNVSRSFGGLQALKDVTMSVPKNQIIGLIGPNGAGKTTLINDISGLDHPSSGSIRFNEVSIEQMPPHQIARLGIARTYQNIRLFSDMTVLENLVISQHRLGKSSILDALIFSARFRQEERALRENAVRWLNRFQLAGVIESRAGSLPYGDQRRLEMARALATQPSLLLLDEPAAGMNPVETRLLGEQILQLKREGMTTLVIEHDMSLIHQVCDAIYVLSFGEIIAFGTPEEIRNNPIVIEAYLGQEENGAA
ncbi:MAG: ATP-binding cassette domain-containing protein [Anaerolineaceae bacterium]|nr:ATP-binding cassette domain-containing protein [Anaerolineaceae bacterium]